MNKGGKNSVNKNGKKSLLSYSLPNTSLTKGDFVNIVLMIIAGVENNTIIITKIKLTVNFHDKQLAVIGG